MRRSGALWRWAIWAVLLLAWSLRIYLLDNQSFAFDEGWTSYAIHHSWGDLWGVLAPDNHPPLYYVLVKAWADWAGYGDFPVRFFSAFCGMALVALVGVLGRRLGGQVAGLAAALFAACSPLLIYYAQEARMYSLMMAWGVASSYCLLRWVDEQQDVRWRVGYVLAATGALYTQYFSALLLFAQNIAVAAWLLWRGARASAHFAQRRPAAIAGQWLWTQLSVVALYAPWLPTAFRQVQIGQGTWWRIPLPPRMILNDIWLFFVLGPHRPHWVARLGPLTAAAALALLVAVLLGWPRRPGRWAWALLLLALPVAVVVWAGSRWPIYTDRYTLIAAPGVALMIGLGVAACWHALPGQMKGWAWLGPAAGSALLAATIVAPWPHLNGYYHQPAYWREDFRRAAQYVMETTGAGDAVVMVGCYQPMMQYYRGAATVLRFPQQGDSVQSEAEAVSALNRAISAGSQVRLVMHSWPTVDPQGLIEGLLRAQCRLQGEHWQRETGQRPIKILNFEGCAPFAVEPRQEIDAVWDGQVALSAYRVIRLSPGVQAHVFLWWQTLRRPDENYSTFVHLLDAEGNMLTQFDTLPLSDFYPMRAWPLRTDQRDDYPLNVPADADLDGAWLAVGVYDRATMQRLPVAQDGAPAGDFIRVPVAP